MLNTKSDFRKDVKNRINEFITSESKRQKISKKICKKIINSKEFLNAKNILVYNSLSDEVDLSFLIKNSINLKKNVAFPKIIKNTQNMEFYKVDFLEEKFYQKNDFGILEPCKENSILFDDFKNQTLVLVPGRAFTKDGFRIGRGKGFYDIYFSKFRENKKIILAGVCFSVQFYENILHDEHDLCMNLVFSD